MPKKRASPANADPHWLSGVHAGYDPGSGKYRNIRGGFITRDQAIRQLEDDLSAFGGLIGAWQPDKRSRAAEKLENIIAGGFTPFTYDKVDTQDRQDNRPHPIPGRVATAYRLANFYYESEGDIQSALETPIQISMRDLDIRCPDPGVKRDLEEMYDVDGLDMEEKLQAAWLSVAVFGRASPFEAYEGDELRGVVLLPPMYTWLGSAANQYSLMPTNGAAEWTEEALRSQLPRVLYDAVRVPEENKPLGFRVDIPEDTVHPIRALDQIWKLYPKPPMQGAFRAIATRIIYEEMRRAVYEGFRNQLWLFLLGDAEHRPSPEMMGKLISDVDGMAGERTGSLAWWGALKVDVVTPKTDVIMSGGEWALLSRDIFRRIGINERVSTGNVMGTGDGRTSDFEIDVDIMLEKYEFMRRQLLRWERGFRLRYAKRMGATFLKACRETEVVFSANVMELRQAIKDRLIPLFTTGALDVESLLTQAGQNYESVRRRKEKQVGESELWSPPMTYQQGVVNQKTGETTATTEIGPQPGRPADGVKASVDDVAALLRETLDYLKAQDAKPPTDA